MCRLRIRCVLASIKVRDGHTWTKAIVRFQINMPEMSDEQPDNATQSGSAAPPELYLPPSIHFPTWEDLYKIPNYIVLLALI